MKLRAVFFDFGGVIMRTEFQAPRQQLAESFNMDYDEIDRAVFASESARRASLGEIAEEEHWLQVLKRFKLPSSELKSFYAAFFAGDVIDHTLVNYIRTLRGKVQTGLISNGWSGLRDYLTREKIIDIFDTLVISAEVGLLKPQAPIFQLALDRAQVQPGEAVFVDDVPENIAGCEAVGMQGILFEDVHETLANMNQFLNLR